MDGIYYIFVKDPDEILGGIINETQQLSPMCRTFLWMLLQLFLNIKVIYFISMSQSHLLPDSL